MSQSFGTRERWIPWVLAYTGARVNEFTQLRGEDIRTETIDDTGRLDDAHHAGGGRRQEPTSRATFRSIRISRAGFPEFVAERIRPVFYDPRAGEPARGKTAHTYRWRESRRMGAGLRDRRR